MGADSPQPRGAAFFDLDRTLMEGSSAFQFGRAAYRAGLLGRRAIRRVMAIDVASTTLVLVATVAGAAVDGARGAVWAVAMAQGLLMSAWLLAFQFETHPRFRHVGRHRRAAIADAEPAVQVGEPALAGRT